MLVPLAAALLASPATEPTAAKPLPPACQQGKLQPVQVGKRAGPHTLDQEPPARQIYTVLRTEDGCTKPVFVNDRVIGGARR